MTQFLSQGLYTAAYIFLKEKGNLLCKPRWHHEEALPEPNALALNNLPERNAEPLNRNFRIAHQNGIHLTSP